MSEDMAAKGTLGQGTVLQNRYQIENVIGRGGFGITYRAKDFRVDIPVAVKEYLPERQMSETEAVRETKMAARFYDLEGIAAARDFFSEGSHAYIVMEYVEGMSVKEYVRVNGRMKGEETLRKLQPIIQSIGKIHQEGVVHRDISADNLMITTDGRLKLVDFGTARFTREYADKPHTLVFKRGFAPIEQMSASGKQGSWTDIYSLCATIYYMITGMIPDDAVERMIDDRLKSLEQMQGTGLRAGEAACIMKGLSVRPKDRWQTVEELGRELYGEAWQGNGSAAVKEDGQKNAETKPVAGGSISDNSGLANGSNGSFTTGFSTTSFLRELRSFDRKNSANKKRTAKIFLAAVFVLVLAGGFLYTVVGRGRGNMPADPGMADSAQPVSPSGLGAESSSEPAAGQGVESTTEPTLNPEPSAPVYTIGKYRGLTKKQVGEKTKELRKAGLMISYKEVYSEKVKKGLIISQKPKTGKTFQNLDHIKLVLTVSKGKKPEPSDPPRSTPAARPTVTAAPRRDSDVDFSGSLDGIPG